MALFTEHDLYTKQNRLSTTEDIVRWLNEKYPIFHRVIDSTGSIIAFKTKWDDDAGKRVVTNARAY